MKKVVIFGATGNVGAYLADYCNERFQGTDYQVIAVGRRETDFFAKKGIEYITLNVLNEEDFAKLPSDDVYAVVNCIGLLPAYLKSFNPFAYVDINITGALRILEYARKNKADRVLYTQTWAEMAGYWGKEQVLSPFMPRKLMYTGDHAFYSITKCMIVDTMEHYKQEYGIKNFVFRMPNVYLYSPEKYYYVDCNKKPVAYRYMIDRAKEGLDIEIWGNPDAFKDILYVKDLCQMMYKAVLADINGGTYNAGTGVKTTLREQIEGIVDVFSPVDNKSRIIEVPDKPTFTSFVMDISNAKEELGFSPQYDYISYLVDYKREEERKRFDELWTK